MLKDLSFITLKVTDDNGVIVPQADNAVVFEVTGAGELVATDNGNPADLVSFSSKQRKAFPGLALAIIKAKKGKLGILTITASSPGLIPATLQIKCE